MTIENAKIILSINDPSDIKKIKENYKKLAKKHHPDKGGSKNKFSEINTAKRILLNQEKSSDPIFMNLDSQLDVQKKIHELWMKHSLGKYLEYKELSLNEIKNKLKNSESKYLYLLMDERLIYENSEISDYSDSVINFRSAFLQKLNSFDDEVEEELDEFLHLFDGEFNFLDLDKLEQMWKPLKKYDPDIVNKLINLSLEFNLIQKIDSDVVWYDRALNIFKLWNEYRKLENERDEILKNLQKI